MEKKCSNCNFCVLDDFGYSNWTVEGSNVYCSKGLNPEAPFDRWYGTDKRDRIAENCEHYADDVGPVDLDCDREDADRTADYGTAEYYAPYATQYVSAEEIAALV